jgi:glycosyltransferase involved in cell wall biosynthesis
MVASLTFGDAIGNEAIYIQSLLRARGFDSEIFAESADSIMSGRARDLTEYPSFSSPENVLILHFSIGSKAASLAERLVDKLMLVYHNITPAHWFAPYSRKIAIQCLQGRRELARLRKRASLSVGVSEYNRQELEDLGFEPTAVLPFLFDPERLTASAHPVISKMYDDQMTNFLFVGRVTPNKHFEDLMKIVKVYQRSIDRKCRLLCVGQWRDVELYYERLIRLADDLELRRVEFPGQVTTEELVAFYRVADVFLCMSEHEGFCAPLLEAFQMGVPVVAYDAGAVPETLGGAGILVHQKKFDEIAELASLLVTDEGLRQRVVDAQSGVLQRVLARDDGALLMQFVDEISAR